MFNNILLTSRVSSQDVTDLVLHNVTVAEVAEFQCVVKDDHRYQHAGRLLYDVEHDRVSLEPGHFMNAQGQVSSSSVPLLSSRLAGNNLSWQIRTQIDNATIRPDHEDWLPFRTMEQNNPVFFSCPQISRFPENNFVYFNDVLNVPINQIRTVVCETDGISALGTYGLGPCIAILGRAVNEKGHTILSLYHYPGIESARTALSSVDESMDTKGMLSQKEFFLIGGNIAPRRASSIGIAIDNCDKEEEFLALQNEYPLRGGALHLSVSEYYSNGVLKVKNTRGINVVITKTQISYRRRPLYAVL